MLRLILAIAMLGALQAVPAFAVPVINEIDANQTGSTDPFEFVELAGPANLSLNGLVVVFFNGNTDTSYRSFDLDGFQLGPTGYFLIGNTSVVPTPDIIFPDTTLQNGADAVALYTANASDFPNGTAVTSTNLLDAIVYGSSSNPPDTELLTTLGQSTQYIDTDTTSISRVPNITGPFTNDTAPTPQNSGVPQVPEPASVFMVFQLLGVGMLALSRERRRVS
jgi:hypothetical protein